MAVLRLSLSPPSVAAGVTVGVKTYPLTAAQAKLAELVAEARRSHRPVTISEHGRAVAAPINVVPGTTAALPHVPFRSVTMNMWS